jgi:putative chitinase
MLTGDVMRTMWPRGDTTVAGLIEGMMAAAPTIFSTYGLASDLVVAHAMAQFSQECGAGAEVVENLNYSAQGLMNAWPSRFDATTAAAFAHDPQKIANEVYNGRMGNVTGSDDGWTYRGRGGSQVTRRDGYSSLGQMLGLDLVGTPDLVNDPTNFLLCAVADFIQCGCLPLAVNDDLSGVTYHLNDGYNGLADRTVWLAKWKSALNVSGAAAHDTLWIQQSLKQLGTTPPLITDGSYGPATSAAVMAFQQAHGLHADGKVGPQTIAALEQALAAP